MRRDARRVASLALHLRETEEGHQLRVVEARLGTTGAHWPQLGVDVCQECRAIGPEALEHHGSGALVMLEQRMQEMAGVDRPAPLLHRMEIRRRRDRYRARR